MKMTKNASGISNGGFVIERVRVGDRDVTAVAANEHREGYPKNSVGGDREKRNYIKYLIERYNERREADSRFGRADRLQYSDLFKRIESKFKKPTYFVPENRFRELAEFLHSQIDHTILGQANRKRGIRNYVSFDEYVMQENGVARRF
jgi:hypothetical protein